jgi:hypothetical protein
VEFRLIYPEFPIARSLTVLNAMMGKPQEAQLVLKDLYPDCQRWNDLLVPDLDGNNIDEALKA